MDSFSGPLPSMLKWILTCLNSLQSCSHGTRDMDPLVLNSSSMFFKRALPNLFFSRYANPTHKCKTIWKSGRSPGRR